MSSADIDDASAFLDWVEERETELKRDWHEGSDVLIEIQLAPPFEDKTSWVRWSPDLYRAVAHLFAEVDAPGRNWVSLRLGFGDQAWGVRGAQDTSAGAISLQFDDGSVHTLDPVRPDSDRAGTPEGSSRDIGPALLLAITAAEFRATEGVLAVLWEALGRDDLTEVQRTQIITIADLITAERNATNPGETPRWKLIGAVRSGLKYLVTGVPRDALAWWKLIELLQGVNWHNVAGMLPH